MTPTTNISGLIALFLTTLTSVSFAGEEIVMDGKELQSLCSDYQEATLKGKLPKDSNLPFMRCAHYMQGVVEASVFYERMMYTVSGNHMFCFPKRTISTTQAILVTNEYIKRHPEKLDTRGVVLVMTAFLEAYSCSK
jgi:hypothetical protein